MARHRRQPPRGTRPGAILRVRIGSVWHEGIATERLDADACPTVVHKSKRTGVVTEDPFALFAPRSATCELVGYPGKLAPADVVARARARVGEPWTLRANCQAFTRSCHGCAPRTPEADDTAAAIGGLALLAARMVRVALL
jgi:hypothetical protein